MNPEKISQMIDMKWEQDVLPVLKQYIAIPAKSRLFDPEWEANGHLQQAAELLKNWAETRQIKGAKIELLKLPGRTPIIFIDVPGQSDQVVLLYGHLDKQPEMSGWAPDLGPWKAVQKGDKLYGRGGADDGYSLFAALTAIETIQKEGLPHARCIVLIEASEESGSVDLPAYLDYLGDRFSAPDLVICLDSGCGNYDQLWCTTSLRGNITGSLKVSILKEGVHSGTASGIVPSSFRILRHLLDRVEDAATGKILLDALSVDIPADRLREAQLVAEALDQHVWREYPWVDQAHPDQGDLTELVLNRAWRPALSVTGADGFPSIKDAGNVLRPFTAFKLSFRIPPSCNAEQAASAIKSALEAHPPYGAKVEFKLDNANPGWEAPPLAKWLVQAIDGASQKYFGQHALYWGEGASIPFMAMLGQKYPEAQFMITGLLGPLSNAHGPNEFVHIPTAKKLSCCVAEVLMQHYQAGVV